MADQERSGPTPEQVEALAEVVRDALTEWDRPEHGDFPGTRSEFVAVRVAVAIAAGEVPGVLVAEGEQREWSVVLANGHRERARSEGIARTWAAEVGGSLESRLVGPWVPADEEASGG